ncbi:MAG TPA: M14 family zinc carboxypeptidase [Vicinamibacterales bacterium]|nr:M14 family zinc carboxypeptidase [Vicinamibacterales bacterium]
MPAARRAFVLALLCGSVSLAAQSSRIPTPESVIGFAPGAEHKLATYDQTIEYFKTLDAASDQMMLMEAGTSTQGRTYYYALISSKENLKKIDRYREIARRLARPAGLSDAQAVALAREGKPLVHIDGGLHSTEVAGPQHTLLLAHDLLSKQSDPQIANILNNVILMLWPTINPDGHQMVADWYMKNIGTANELLPRLYQEYVGHDNNRDAYMLNMIESRVMEHAWRQWEPQIIYVQHQSSPFPTRIWLPPFAEPIASHAPFLMSREVNTIGMAIAQGLEERGQVGATHMGTGYDAWYAGYVDYTPMFKNIASFWTETALAGLANTREYKIDAFPREYRDLRPQALYTSPWAPGTWTLRDAVEYMETASLSVLDYAARYKENVLLNRYRSGKWQIEKHRKEGPFAYFIPQQQRDGPTAADMLRRLAFSGVRVYQTTGQIIAEGETFRAGTWVIPTDQEFIALAREVLDPQVYPDLREFEGGPPEQPYDAAGWTLPMTMGVRVVTVTKPLSAEDRSRLKVLAGDEPFVITPTPYSANTSDAESFDSVPGSGFNTNPMAAAIRPLSAVITGSGAHTAISPAETNAFRVINEAWKQNASVSRSGDKYVISGMRDDWLLHLASSLGVNSERVGAPGAAMKKPRIALFEPPNSMDAGWTKWVLERYGFEFASVDTPDITGNLRDKFDVIVVGDERRAVLPGGGFGRPAATTPSAEDEGRIKAIDTFVRNGGTLVAMSSSAAALIDQLKLPVRNVLNGVGRDKFFAGGSVMRVNTDPSQPVMAGMPTTADVFVFGSPAFETTAGFDGAVLATYPNEGSPLRSGYLLGEQYLRGKAAALDVRLGDGHVILLGFRPQWRGQPFGTFRVLFNSLLR